jgi:ketosteroid isomerase-like protein
MTNPEQTAKRWVELFDKKDLRGLMALYSENCVNAPAPFAAAD